jgi:hypothetical protein
MAMVAIRLPSRLRRGARTPSKRACWVHVNDASSWRYTNTELASHTSVATAHTEASTASVAPSPLSANVRPNPGAGSRTTVPLTTTPGSLKLKSPL